MEHGLASALGRVPPGRRLVADRQPAGEARRLGRVEGRYVRPHCRRPPTPTPPDNCVPRRRPSSKRSRTTPVPTSSPARIRCFLRDRRVPHEVRDMGGGGRVRGRWVRIPGRWARSRRISAAIASPPSHQVSFPLGTRHASPVGSRVKGVRSTRGGSGGRRSPSTRDRTSGGTRLAISDHSRRQRLRATQAGLPARGAVRASDEDAAAAF